MALSIANMPTYRQNAMETHFLSDTSSEAAQRLAMMGKPIDCHCKE